MKLPLSLLISPVVANSFAAETQTPGRTPHCANPILPGYFADPSIVQESAATYIYATLDPWGDKTLGCWESTDFKNWTYRVLNWPTKAACTSKTSKGANVWAPSVVKGRDGRFHMVISVGSEVWAGVAEHPLGPWRNALGGQPLIPHDFRPGFHMIDAEYFIDEDGQTYLYWGSGLNWVNGRCWAVKLQPDMVTFDGEVKDVTPTSYFEAPFMVKRHGKYFLTYSAGKTTEDSYQIHYAVGDSPFGPFVEGPGSPILTTNKESNIVSPGHHALFERDGQDYVLYHRHSIPFNRKFIGRQVCVDPIVYTAHGRIEKIEPTHQGPALIQGRAATLPELLSGTKVTASSSHGPMFGPEFVLDDNYATRWAAATDAKGAWIQLDFGETKLISRQSVRPEFAWKPCRFISEASTDGETWQQLVDFSDRPASGSPIEITTPVNARFLRITFPDTVPGSEISLIEWTLL